MTDSEPTTIFVVDDEPAVPEFIGRLLLSDNPVYSVECFDGAAACLQRMSVREPALVISDIWMPNMDGIAFLDKCRELHPEVEVILITAEPSLPSVMQAIQMEAFCYLEKPFPPESLRQAVRKALAKRRMLRLARKQLDASPTPPSLSDPASFGAGSFFAAAWEFLPGEALVLDAACRIVTANRSARLRFNLGRRLKPHVREVPPLDRLSEIPGFSTPALRTASVSQLNLEGRLVRATWAEFLDGVQFCIVWFA
jgi:CheY-like chemotaxis protein